MKDNLVLIKNDRLSFITDIILLFRMYLNLPFHEWKGRLLLYPTFDNRPRCLRWLSCLKL